MPCRARPANVALAAAYCVWFAGLTVQVCYAACSAPDPPVLAVVLLTMLTATSVLFPMWVWRSLRTSVRIVTSSQRPRRQWRCVEVPLTLSTLTIGLLMIFMPPLPHTRDWKRVHLIAQIELFTGAVALALAAASEGAAHLLCPTRAPLLHLDVPLYSDTDTETVTETTHNFI